jgi:hypothetical protein
MPMKKICLLSILILMMLNINSQTAVGDTIVVKSFKYGSPTRDTMINFPSNSLTFEKIIMKYNMRCKNNLISTQSAPNQGCGEWDYSCNTYIVDSSKIENALKTHPNYIISNFTGTVFPHTSLQLFDYYDYNQTNVNLTSIVSENQYTVGAGNTAVPNLIKANQTSGRTQILYTASELTAAGLTPGPLHGIIVNVANSGGIVNFLKVKLQHTALTSLNSNTLTLTGYTEVCSKNYTFVTGDNRIQFYTPFNWDGTSNVIIDLSFTNTVPTNSIVLNGVTTPSNMALYANNNRALDLSSLGHVVINTSSLTSINNELTVTFWAYGTASLMPTNTSILYGYAANANERHLNLHLPWSDNNIYYDAGFAAGNYDRINKVATALDQGGQWNHWAFTKNAATGNMKIYLNGVLWHSGTGKTKAMSILNLLLGKNNNLGDNYKGKVNELSIWDKELSLNDIQNWMNKNIDATHPFYANLVAYYKMTEGTGLTINDSKFALSSTGVNLQWTYERGDKLTRMFNETTLRPNVVFLRGTYTQSTSTLTVRDSVARNPNTVNGYSITSNATVTPMAHDVVALATTASMFEASPIKIYNGETSVLTGTLPVATQGTITIFNLNYYERYPFYNEIMSFVTPYGKGLSMGATGKSWYYDVTDLAPLLVGSKRMLMTLGGQYQEQMDIDFIFIVGTPPRNVLQFNQLWQGAARDGGASLVSINNDTRFATQSVPLLSNGKQFKMRSTVTGHGSEGEFHQNGGLIDHYINVNGGPNEFTWLITQDCSMNPVYPQGGTWVYDRQGWCPGETSLLKQHDLTPLVTPGTTVTLDYNCSAPQVPGGDYRYIAAHQLITYGNPNHSVDANIVDILAPSTKVLYSRSNPICSRPLILVQNTGSTSITSLEIDYWVNNSSSKQTYTWTGSLAFMDTVSIYLPINALWQNGLQASNNVFNVELKKANSMVDDYSYNNMYHSAFVMPAVISSSFAIDFKTNNNYLDNNYKIYDDNGNVVGASSFTAANTSFFDKYTLYGCYKLVVQDLGGDGLQWWANTGQGNGSVKITDHNGNVLKSFQPDFGGGIEFSFTTDSPLSITENALGSQVNVYPNPSLGKFLLEGTALDDATFVVTDVLGSIMNVPSDKKSGVVEFDGTQLKPGIYFVIISKGNSSVTKKVVIH